MVIEDKLVKLYSVKEIMVLECLESICKLVECISFLVCRYWLKFINVMNLFIMIFWLIKEFVIIVLFYGILIRYVIGENI